MGGKKKIRTQKDAHITSQNGRTTERGNEIPPPCRTSEIPYKWQALRETCLCGTHLVISFSSAYFLHVVNSQEQEQERSTEKAEPKSTWIMELPVGMWWRCNKCISKARREQARKRTWAKLNVWGIPTHVTLPTAKNEWWVNVNIVCGKSLASLTVRNCTIPTRLHVPNAHLSHRHGENTLNAPYGW